MLGLFIVMRGQGQIAEQTVLKCTKNQGKDMRDVGMKEGAEGVNKSTPDPCKCESRRLLKLLGGSNPFLA